MHSRSTKGQSALELCIMLAVVIMALIALQHYIKYAAAGRLKSSADSISQSLFNPHNSDTELDVDRITKDTMLHGTTLSGSDAGKLDSVTDGSNTDAKKTKDVSSRIDKLL